MIFGIMKKLFEIETTMLIFRLNSNFFREAFPKGDIILYIVGTI